MRKIFFLILIYLSNNLFFAQFNTLFQNPKSPEVYNMERYGNQNVNLYTGRPNINIPLYEVKYGGMSFPLSISYTSNGIKGDEEASRVGLGWYMDLPMITQTIQGFDDLSMQIFLPDYYHYYKPYHVITPQPDYWYEKKLSNPNAPAYAGIQNERLNISSSFKANPVNHLTDFFMAKVKGEGSGFFGNQLLYYPKDGVLYNYNLDYKNDNYGERFDIEMDIFQLNLFGERLIFYKNANKNSFFCLNKKGYKIDYELLSNINYSPKFKFTITNLSGIKYVFEEQQDTKSQIVPGNSNQKTQYIQSTLPLSVPTSYDYNPQLGGMDLSARQWKLTQIIDVDNNMINFNYLKLPLSYKNINSVVGKCDFLKIYQPSIDYYDPAHTPYPQMNYFPIADQNNPFGNFESAGEKISCYKQIIGAQMYQDTYLSQINFGITHIDFLTSNRTDIVNEKKIDQINIKNNIHTVKSIKFSYSYYPENHTLSKRMKLDSLDINNEKYVFQYNNINIPKYTDYWGYYNGIVSQTPFTNPFRLYQNSSYIPQWALGLHEQAKNTENKSAHPENIKVGILEKIIYPTKGYSKYEYELNTFNNFFFPNYDNKINLNSQYQDYDQNFSSGYGLRVKSISDFNENGLISLKQFSYEGGKHIPPYKPFNDNDKHNLYFYTYNSSSQKHELYKNTGEKITSYSSTIFQSNFLGNGDFVGYDNVSIKEISNSEDKGKTVYYFTNKPDARPSFGIGDGTSQFEKDKFGYGVRTISEENGDIIKKEIFDSNNILLEQDSIIYKNDIFYDPLNCYNVKVVNAGTSLNLLDQPMFNVTPLTFSNYYFFYYPMVGRQSVIEHSIEKKYLKGKTITTKNDFSYNSEYNIPELKTTTLTNNDIILENTKYTYTIPRFKNKNILNGLAGKYVIKNNKLLFSNSIKYDDISHNKPTSEIADEINGSNNSFINFIYDRYDNKGNLIQYTDKSGVSTSIVWGYDQTFPIAIIVGAKYSEIEDIVTEIINASNTDNLAPPHNDESTFLNILDDFRKSPKLLNHLTTTYTYDPIIGIRSITSPEGLRNVYIYNENNKLLEIRENSDNGKIVKEYKYNFAPMKYYNSIKSQNFTRNNCGNYFFGGSHEYTVPVNTYFSYISQAEADQLAQNNINENGQNEANLHGTCMPMNCSITKGSGINNINYGSVTWYDNNNIRIYLGYKYISSLPWDTTGVIVGKLNGNCNSANVRNQNTYSNTLWGIIINPNGDIILKRSLAAAPPADGTNINLDFLIPIN